MSGRPRPALGALAGRLASAFASRGHAVWLLTHEEAQGSHSPLRPGSCQGRGEEPGLRHRPLVPRRARGHRALDVPSKPVLMAQGLLACGPAGHQAASFFPGDISNVKSSRLRDCSNSLHCPHKARAARPQTNRPHALSRRRERGVSVRQTVQLRRTFPLARPWFPAPRLRLRGVPAAPAPTPRPDSPRGSAAVIGL